MKKIRNKGRVVDMGKNLPAPAPRVFKGKLASLTIDGVEVKLNADTRGMTDALEDAARRMRDLNAATRDSAAPPPYVVTLHASALDRFREEWQRLLAERGQRASVCLNAGDEEVTT